MSAVDIDALAAAIEDRRRRRWELGIGRRCAATEARVLAAMLVEPFVLERCDDVETEDFADPRHQLLFMALRAVQADQHLFFGLDDVMSWLERNQYLGVTWFDLGDLIAGTSNYGSHDTVQLARDMEWLRTLAIRRRAS